MSEKSAASLEREAKRQGDDYVKDSVDGSGLILERVAEAHAGSAPTAPVSIDTNARKDATTVPKNCVLGK